MRLFTINSVPLHNEMSVSCGETYKKLLYTQPYPTSYYGMITAANI